MARLFGLLVIAFNIWMYIDASRRRNIEDYWRWVVILVPGGSVAYFFLVRLRQSDVQATARRLLAELSLPPDVDSLEGQYKRTPSVKNRTSLAQGLYDAGRFTEAMEHFDAIRAEDPKNLDALHGLGVCLLERGEPKQAAALLTDLLEREPRYRDYLAYPDAAAACWKAGERDRAIELCAELVRLAPRMQHVVLHAEYLENAGRSADAKRMLARAVDEARHEPKHIRRRDRPWVRKAKQMLAAAR